MKASSRILLMVLATFVLQGCFSQYHNTEAAYESFPEIPANPDGVCPDLTGTYYAYVCSEESGGFTVPRRLPERFIGKRIDQITEKTTSEEQPKMIQSSKKELPKCTPSLVLQSFVAFRYLDPERLEARSWGSTGTVSSKIYDPNSFVKVICDKRMGYWQDKGESYGLEGGGINEVIETLSRTPNGDIIVKRYRTESLYALRKIPTGGSRTINTYRYKAYHGSMPKE